MNEFHSSFLFSEKAEEQSGTASEIKTENEMTSEDPTKPIESTDTSDKKTVDQSEFSFHSDVAMFHSSALQKLKERTSLLSNVGPHRRALCARRDLEMRRQLCKADKVSFTSIVDCCF